MHIVHLEVVMSLLIGAVSSWELCANETLRCKSGFPMRACRCDGFCAVMNDCCVDFEGKYWSADKPRANQIIGSVDIRLYRGHLACYETSANDSFTVNTYLRRDEFVYVKTCPKYSRKDLKLLCEDENSKDLFLNWFVSSRTTKVTYRNIYCSQCWNDTDVFQWKVEFACGSEDAPIPKVPPGSPDHQHVTKGVDCKFPDVSDSGLPGKTSESLPPGFGKDKSPGNHPNMPGSGPRPPPGSKPLPPGVSGGAPGISSRHAAVADQQRGKTRIQKRATGLGLHVIPPPRDKYATLNLSRYRFRRTSGSRPKRSGTDDCLPRLVYPLCDNLRACEDLRTVSTCQDRWKGTTVERICREGGFGRMMWQKYGTTYRNIDCVVCNGVHPELPKCRHNHNFNKGESGPTGPTNGEDGVGGLPPTLSMIFDPEAGRLIKETRTKRESIPLPKCSATQILDLFAYRCRDVSCPSGYELVSGTCAKSTASGRSDRTCLWIKFGRGEFKVVNMSSVVLITGHVIPIEDNAVRNLTDTTVLICDDQLPDGWNTTKVIFNYSDGAAVLSVFLHTVSLICLLLQFVVYLLLPALRNTPGLTIMSLVVALFYAQFLLLVSGTAAGQHGGCVFIAVAIHYFYLASFCWMSCLALDLALTFSSTVVVRGDDHSKIRRFIKFSIFAWLAPFVIISLALIMDAGEKNTYPFNPAYGQGFCWITHKQALYLWFLTPAALLLTSSLVLYTITVYKIVAATKATKMVRREDKLNLFLYVKLALIMGITWVLAFIWIGTKDVAMEYLFIIFNSLQGAFIFVAFVCRKKVYYMLKRKLTGKKSEFSRTTLNTKTTNSATGERKSATL